MIIILRKRTVKIILLIALLGISANTAYRQGIAVETPTVETAAPTDWGLSFREEGNAPAANADAGYLKGFSAYYVEISEEKNVYLTFDTGYENGNTARILDTLRKHDVKAAFFLVGHYIKTSPELVRRMTEEGHTVGNHTYSHPDMSKISDIENFREEIVKLEDAFREATGREIDKYYRPPQGKFNEKNLRMARELGYSTVFWSLAYVDWQENSQPTRQEAFEKLIPRLHPGAVLLLHSTSGTNADILDELLTEYKNMGYSFKTLDYLCR
jgi:peptidoglycan-N-acetylmuramic acid deacetylase